MRTQNPPPPLFEIGRKKEKSKKIRFRRAVGLLAERFQQVIEEIAGTFVKAEISFRFPVNFLFFC